MKFITCMALASSVSSIQVSKNEGLFTPKMRAPEGEIAISHPVDYFVPNFGVDNDIKETIKHTSDLESKFGVWTPKKSAPADKDYKVPNLGMDVDIIASQESLESEESR